MVQSYNFFREFGSYCHQRFADWRWAGFSAQKFFRRTELAATTKLSSGDETPPIANVLLYAAFLSVILS